MRIIGLDIGEKRIGVAVSDMSEKTAFPLKVISAADDKAAVSEIKDLAAEYEAGKIVYGIPYTSDGRVGTQAERVSMFMEELKRKLDVPFEGQDERYTTSEADRVLIGQDVKRSRRREVIDKIAAAIILQSYLDGKNG